MVFLCAPLIHLRGPCQLTLQLLNAQLAALLMGSLLIQPTGVTMYICLPGLFCAVIPQQPTVLSIM